jgi:hypothetical protein
MRDHNNFDEKPVLINLFPSLVLANQILVLINKIRPTTNL